MKIRIASCCVSMAKKELEKVQFTGKGGGGITLKSGVF